MTINQNSARAIVNWRGFSIGTGEAVRINQPSASSAILNRVTGNDMSAIYGRLQSNGQVYLLNPHGILIGPSGQIDTAGFIASTLRTSNEEFMGGGKLTLQGSSSASIVNLGTITANDGDVVLIAARVDNQGTIQAPNGAVALVASSKVLYVPESAGEILIEGPATPIGEAAAVNNDGIVAAAKAELKAAGTAYALAVNNGGQVSATAVRDVGGKVIVDAGAGDAVSSGMIVARQGDKGGAVDVLGRRIALTGSALIDASGPAGGGAVHIGGGAQGADPSLANAQTAAVGPGATIRASATTDGNGGSVVVWSDGSTSFQGSIEATGGPRRGDGGSAEISGHSLLFSGHANLSAPKGATGTLLLDPLVLDSSDIPGIVTSLGSSNVTETAADSITVSSAISNLTTTNTLTLDAPIVAINADISLPNGGLTFGTSGAAGTSVTSASSATLAVGLTSIAGSYQSVNLAGPITTSNGISYNPQTGGGTPGSFIADNSANQIPNLYLTNGSQSISGDVDVRSTTAMLVANKLTTTGNLTLVAGGNLAFGGGTPTLNVDGTTTLASTGGAFNDNGSLALGGTGRKIIYSSTDASPFNVTGLGYTQINPVSFQNDPQGSGNVIYIKTASGLPLLTITADGKTITYGSADPTFTGTLTGGSASDLTSPVKYQVSGAHSNVGSYTITPFSATSSTFRISFANGTLTINPVTLTVTADAKSRDYGSANPSLTASNSGLFNGDSLATIVPNLALSTTATTSSNVGDYAITPTGTSTSTNYTLSLVPGTLKVTPAPLTIRANDASKTYGAANPAFSAQYTGLTNGDSSAVVSGLALSTSATNSSPAGNYNIVPTGASASNYSITYSNGTLTVGFAPLKVSTSSASVVYGNAAPTLTNTYTGLVAGDTPASVNLGYATAVVPGTGVGSYTTTLAGSASNYIVTYQPGTITVTPAPLTITASDAARLQGEANPQFTVTVTGLFGNDTLNNLQVTTPATTSSPPGSYAIIPSSTMPNYTVTYVNGTLTVNAQDIILTINGNLITSPNLISNNIYSATDTNAKLKILFNNATKSQPVVVGYNFLGSSDPNLVGEQSKIIDSFVDAMAKAGVKVDANEVGSALSDPATRDATMGTLLPFIYSDLNDILALDSSKWTPQQAALVTAVENYIHDQKVAAANEGQKEYDAWKAGQEQKLQEDTAGKGIAGVYASMIDAANPEGPPQDFLQRSQSGMVLTNNQLNSFDAINDQVATMGEQAAAQAQALSNAMNSDQATAEVANLELSRVGDLLLTANKNSLPQYSDLEQKYNDAVQNIYSADPATRAQAMKDLNAVYQTSGLPPISPKELASVSKVTNVPVSSTDSTLGYLPGAISDAGKLLSFVSGSAGNTSDLVKLSPKVFGKIFPNAKIRQGIANKINKASEGEKAPSEVSDVNKTTSETTKTEETVTDTTKAINTTTKTTEDVAETTADVAKIVAGAGEVLATAGVVIEVVGNLVQIGVGVAGYVNIGDYEKALNDTSTAAKQTVTTSDLKSMDANTLFTYLTAMTATGGGVKQGQ